MPANVTVRLLGKKGMAALTPAVELAAQQYKLAIAVRSNAALHDRFIFLDTNRGFSSGSSFKDGARQAPTIFTEVTDALPAIHKTYEQMWSSSVVHR